MTQSKPPRLALVFPPALHPTSPPLGVSLLYAWLRRELPGLELAVFDLNLAFFRQALEWMAGGRLRVGLKGLDHEQTARRAARAVAFLRGEQGLCAFCDLERYEDEARIYRSLEQVVGGLFDHMARRAAAGLELPPLVERFFAELWEPVRRFQAQWVGFSLLFSQQLPFALAQAAELKRAGARVLLGGATLSVMPRPERLLGPLPWVVGGRRLELKGGSLVDALLVGEGEKGLLALMRGEPPEQVPGLVYRRGEKPRHNPPGMVRRLERLPAPDFSWCRLEGYHSPRPVLPYLSARGCFWGRCAFCTHQKTYLAYREEPVQQTVRHLEELARRHGVRHFSLVDEMVHPRRLRSLSRAILERGLDIRFSAYAKPSGGFDRRSLELAHRAGLRVALWGVESGSRRVLKLMNKGTDPAQVQRVLGLAAEAGIWNLVFMIFGFPTESEAEWRLSLDFLRRNRRSIHALSKSRFLLLAGSEVMRRPQDFGITRVRDRRMRDPMQIAYDYEVEQGLGQEEVARRYRRLREELEGVGRSPFFALLRDHMLIHAACRDHAPAGACRKEQS